MRDREHAAPQLSVGPCCVLRLLLLLLLLLLVVAGEAAALEEVDVVEAAVDLELLERLARWTRIA